MSDQPKRMGRPPKSPGKGRRRNYTFRMSDADRDRVVAAAEVSGRSMSEELEARIVESFRAQDLRAVVREELDAVLRPKNQPGTYGIAPSGAECIDYIKRVGVGNIPVKRDH